MKIKEDALGVLAWHVSEDRCDDDQNHTGGPSPLAGPSQWCAPPLSHFLNWDWQRLDVPLHITGHPFFTQMHSCLDGEVHYAPTYRYGIFRHSGLSHHDTQLLTPGYRCLEKRPMHQKTMIGKIGLIRRELDSKACPVCGSDKHQLVLRGDMQPQSGGLFARCSQYQRPHLRWLNEDFGLML